MHYCNCAPCLGKDGIYSEQFHHAFISYLIEMNLLEQYLAFGVEMSVATCLKLETSWVCSATLEFDYRFGWGWVGLGLNHKNPLICFKFE